MLNRTDILKRLIEVRQVIYRKEEIPESPPAIEDIKIKKDIDKLIRDIIGEFLNEKDKEYLDKILLKTICEEIPVSMAMVAIKEIVQAYYNDNNNNYNNEESNFDEEKLAASYYQKGYR